MTISTWACSFRRSSI